MNWTTICILLGIFVAFYLLKRRGQISAKEARTQLKNGALLVDVRTPAEFTQAAMLRQLSIFASSDNMRDWPFKSSMTCWT